MLKLLALLHVIILLLLVYIGPKQTDFLMKNFLNEKLTLKFICLYLALDDRAIHLAGVDHGDVDVLKIKYQIPEFRNFNKTVNYAEYYYTEL